MGAKKYTFDDVVREFEKTDYIFLSDCSEYINSSIPSLRYLCPRHLDKGEMKISLGHLKDGRGCYYCGREKTINARRVDFDKDGDRELCESHNFEYVDTLRKNGKIVIAFICRKHSELGVQYMTKYNMKRDIKGCKYCCGKKLPEWYVMEKAKEINPDIELLEPYKDLTTRMNCLCRKHNIITRKSMQNILHGQGCRLCGIEKLSQTSYLTLEEYQKRVNLINDNIKVLEYGGMACDAKFQCKKCGNVWYSYAATMVNTGKQCPNCEHYYTGERYIQNLLDCWDIDYTKQMKFADCRDKRPLPFDFYINNKNACIEFDGLQHFVQRDVWSDLVIVQYHDDIKTSYCINNNMPLLRISYDDEDIEGILFDFLIKIGSLEEIQVA